MNIQKLNKKLHIVSFDIPFPADYGGVVDVYHKVKALKKIGISVHLHCFEYGRQKSPELLEVCAKVSYYKRNRSLLALLSATPFIVESRKNTQLLLNLISDDSPVLFEGLHCSGYSSTLIKNGKKVFIRAHNVEHNYYTELSKAEKSFFRKIYFKIEALKLKKFEKKLNRNIPIISISKNDVSYFKRFYDKVAYIPAFHVNDKVSSLIGDGKYAIYHGNLSVAENIKAVRFLIGKIFKNLDIHLIIAGKNPTNELLEMQSNMVSVVPNPSTVELVELVQNAHINVLPSFQSTGIKLKLLFALFNGRFCLVSPELAPSKEISTTAIVCNSIQDWKNRIDETLNLSFSEDDLAKRTEYAREFDNSANAKKLVEFIF